MQKIIKTIKQKLLIFTMLLGFVLTLMISKINTSAQYSSFNADIIPNPPYSINYDYISDLQSGLKALNNGRQIDPTVNDKSPVKLPSYFEQLTVPRQTLILLNQERRIRGLAPFTGLSTNLSLVAQGHASNMYNTNRYEHTLDGAGPWDRMDANEFVRNCREFHPYGESMVGGGGRNTQIGHVLDGIYQYIYFDGPGSRNAEQGWGHRKHLLSAFNENSGSSSNEGVMGVGYIAGPNGEYSVINTIDQAASCGV